MSTQPYSPSGERVTTLFTQSSPHGAVEAVRVDYAPGGYTASAHRHPYGAHVHVLTGAVRMGLDDKPATVYHAGESLYEPPEVTHTISANDSDTEPASIIAFFVVGDGDAPTTVPVDAQRVGHPAT
jgi:quercetin dioxygenase-like cupin family protein